MGGDDHSSIHIPILRYIQKVPGGLMTVFFLAGSLVNTFVPSFLEIGSFTTGLFKEGAVPLIGLVLFCSGSQISFARSGIALYKGSLLLGAKVLIGIAAGSAASVLVVTGGSFLSIHPITVITVLACGNGGLYMALAERYGDEADVASGALVMLSASPFFVFIGASITGLAQISILDIIAVITPVVIGMVLGNLDGEFREFLKPGIRLSIPFFSFALGANISLQDIVTAGFQGALLAVLTVLLTGLGLAGIYALLVPSRWRRTNAVAAGIGNTAGSAVIVPALVGMIDHSFQPYVVLATAQVGASAILTAVLCPVLVRYIYVRESQRKADQEGIYL